MTAVLLDSSKGLRPGKMVSNLLSSCWHRIQELLKDLTIWVIFTGFKFYNAIATVFLLIYFPFTKYFVDKRFKSFGIIINGPQSIDPKVINGRGFYPRVAIEGWHGFAEAYIDGHCDVKDLEGMFTKILWTRRQREVLHPLTWVLYCFNLQSKGKGSMDVVNVHYNGVERIVAAMLHTDKYRQYTCGYWKDANNLEDAQFAKLDMIARKLKLKPGMRVLELGCGYGTLAHFLAKNYGVSVVALNISEEQLKYARKHGVGLSCEFRLCDYREMKNSDEVFDRIVSVGMLEHVGSRNYRTFYEICHRCLTDDGILLTHCMGNPHSGIYGHDWFMNKYVFPNSGVPYYLNLCNAMEGLWIIEDWHNMGYDYYKTIVEWERNFNTAWPQLEKDYGEKFHRMWVIFLHIAKAVFKSRAWNLWQMVLSKNGIKEGYYSVR